MIILMHHMYFICTHKLRVLFLTRQSENAFNKFLFLANNQKRYMRDITNTNTLLTIGPNDTLILENKRYQNYTHI